MSILSINLVLDKYGNLVVSEIFNNGCNIIPSEFSCNIKIRLLQCIVEWCTEDNSK